MYDGSFLIDIVHYNDIFINTSLIISFYANIHLEELKTVMTLSETDNIDFFIYDKKY